MGHPNLDFARNNMTPRELVFLINPAALQPDMSKSVFYRAQEEGKWHLPAPNQNIGLSSKAEIQRQHGETTALHAEIQRRYGEVTVLQAAIQRQRAEIVDLTMEAASMRQSTSGVLPRPCAQ
jgi:hypothetical protein